MASLAIIGAGMAGATAAGLLSAAGHAVSLFDKGRQPGGRMAARRLAPGLTLDHGAQYMTARDPGFAALVQGWASEGVAAPWGEDGWWVGTPDMTAPVQSLLGGSSVASHRRVTRLLPDAAGWRLADASGGFAGPFDAVLVTAPAPQARALIATAGVSWPEAAALEQVRYAPCWAVMVAHAGAPAFEAAYARQPAPSIAWIARDGTKPGRAGGEAETLVLHARPEWSRANLERAAEDVAARLTADLRRTVGWPPSGADHMIHMAAHRWRYALVEAAMGEPCLWSPGLRLGVAGDGCLGGRVEAAHMSGRALAQRVLEDGW